MKEKRLFGYDYSHREDIKLILYLFVGGTAALVEWTLFYLFFTLLTVSGGIAPVWAIQIGTVSAFLLSTLYHYILGNYLVFTSGSRYGRKKEMTYVFLVSICGLGWSMLFMYGFTSGLNLPPMIAKIATSAIVVIWNYLARKKWIYSQ